MTPGWSLDDQIDVWRSYLAGAAPVARDDLDELESHLREQITDLSNRGLDEDEAFLIAVKRIGSVDEISREFAAEHSDRLWRQLMVDGRTPGHRSGRLQTMAGFALAAAAIVAVFQLTVDIAELSNVWAKTVPLLVLAVLAGYVATRRNMAGRQIALLGAPVVTLAIVVNAYPFAEWSDTEVLAAIHVPISIWAVVGLAYLGGDWRPHAARMNFVRFTGEWFVYYVLIALGGGVLTAFTAGTFFALGIDVEGFVAMWMVPCGAAGAVIVAAWLVEVKQRVIENIAPVPTMIFTPLFGAMLVASVVAAAIGGAGIETDREVLILFDLLLIVVTGLVLYSVSARDRQAPPRVMDAIQLVTIGAAVILDLIGLSAMLIRISEFGFSPNKTVALVLNLILLVTLTRTGLLLLGFLCNRRPFADIEEWQTTSLPIYAVWAGFVVVVIPVVFGFA